MMAEHLQGHRAAAPMAAGPTGPLRGVRVVDLTRAVAGPFATMLLADLGADVVKVEPSGGDIPRFSGPFTRDDRERAFGGLFGSINRNKRGVVLDLDQPDDRQELLRLVDGADVLVENFRVGVMERWDLSYETLHARTPQLVYAAIRGFGDPRTGTSPMASWPAFDIVARAMAGVVSMTGSDDPGSSALSLGDLYPATVAALGITAAVLHARATGEGQFMDVALVDSLVALCETAVYRYSYTGAVSRPAPVGHPQLSPFGVFRTLDGACAIAAPTPNHWEALCRAMGREDLQADERTATNRARVANCELVVEVVAGWTGVLTTGEVVGRLGGVVPVGPVNDAANLFTDAHLHARGMLVAVDHPGAERPVVYPNCPIRFTGTPTGIYRRAPRLGEHNEDVLGAGPDAPVGWAGDDRTLP
jgi:crotonobetainyl-CoA:carnitine CoA-transferase CaiB-like acyl-CoA transferase